MNAAFRILFVVALLVAGAQTRAEQISINFSENSGNQEFVGGELIGPLFTDSANWNNTNGQPDLAAGSLTGLIDSTGANTGASLSWASSNAWYNDDGTGNDEDRMSVGYLDDGDPGVSITVDNIPYANYRVYGILGSDQGASYDSLDFQINGEQWVFGGDNAAPAPAYGSINAAQADVSASWIEADGSVRGNYWTYETSGSSLTIQGQIRNGTQRGSIGAIIIADLDARILDPFLRATVDRDTGVVSVTNNTGADVDIAGISLFSNVGALSPSEWQSVASSGDSDSGGSVDADDQWLEFISSANELSEGTLGTTTLGDEQTIELGAAWSKYITEDVRFEFADLENNLVRTGLVSFTGNGGRPFARGDLNFDGSLDGGDWTTFLSSVFTDTEGQSDIAAYSSGDFNGDGIVDIYDADEFVRLYDAANGTGAFAVMSAAVPEPGSVLLAAFGLIGVCLVRFGRRLQSVSALVPASCVVLMLVGNAQAQRGDFGINFTGRDAAGSDQVDLLRVESGASAGMVAGAPGTTAGWNDVFTNGTENDLIPVLSTTGGRATVTWNASGTWSHTADASRIVPAEDPTGDMKDGHIEGSGQADQGNMGHVTATVSGLQDEFASYDIYVYVGDGAGGRLGDISLNGGALSQFTSKLYDGTLTEVTSSGAVGDYVKYSGVTGNAFTVDLTAANADLENRTGIQGIEIIGLTDPTEILTLEVNKGTGEVRIANNAQSTTADISQYQIVSAGGGLNATGWNSLAEQGVDSIGSEAGQSWAEADASGASGLFEGFLLGSTSFGLGDSMSLGNAYNTSMAAEDLAFTYQTTEGDIFSGLVAFVDGPSLELGDTNGDGFINAEDLANVGNNWDPTGANQPHTRAGGDLNGDGFVNAEDLAEVGNNWNPTGSVSVSGAAVPEPATASLCLLVGAALAFSRRNGMNWLKPCLAAMAGMFLLVGSAGASVTVDRLYKLGEEEGGSAGSVIGADFGGFSYDSVGELGAGNLQDLFASGSPTYVAANNPAASGSTLAASFSGSGGFLEAARFGLPETSEAAVAGLDGLAPENYSGIANRGYQFWVKPGSDNTLQSVIMDTNQHGVQITADGVWSMRYSGANYASETSVQVGEWTHVMLVRPAGAASGSRLYVNGIAVVAGGQGYDGADDSPLIIGANTTVGETPAGTQEYFQGQIDEVEMFLMGTNGAGENLGAFSLAEDNDFIAEALSDVVIGDLTGDGQVTGTGLGDTSTDDVAAFIANWGFTNMLGGVAVGDLTTVGQGDLNLDGRVNMTDWLIIRGAHSDPGSLNLAGLLGGAAVPEPTTVALLGIGLLLGFRLLPRRK